MSVLLQNEFDWATFPLTYIANSPILNMLALFNLRYFFCFSMTKTTSITQNWGPFWERAIVSHIEPLLKALIKVVSSYLLKKNRPQISDKSIWLKVELIVSQSPLISPICQVANLSSWKVVKLSDHLSFSTWLFLTRWLALFLQPRGHRSSNTHGLPPEMILNET